MRFQDAVGMVWCYLNTMSMKTSLQYRTYTAMLIQLAKNVEDTTF